jgi:hypothetical protein
MYPAYWLKWGLHNFLFGVALNYDPPDLCLLSSYDYGHESTHPADAQNFKFAVKSSLLSEMFLD